MQQVRKQVLHLGHELLTISANESVGEIGVIRTDLDRVARLPHEVFYDQLHVVVELEVDGGPPEALEEVEVH